MLGCSDARMLGCSDARMLGCSDARMLGCSDARMLGCSDARMLGCSDARMLGCSDARMLGMGLRAFGFPDAIFTCLVSLKWAPIAGAEGAGVPEVETTNTQRTIARILIAGAQ
ncbi:hypothetical protein V5R04_02240 [Jonesiaceae bacterium BS-20]|uniref:Carbonic anhydrase n=1 Tax=Jonesiaceae bacterium BS-20 TaxID=3120821 RepID=A0AAU7DYD5_9MICO